MPAQNGSGVVLTYGAQGKQQRGDALVLDYASLTGTRRLSTTTHTPWHGTAILRDTLAVPSAPSTERITRAFAPWRGSASLRATDRASWFKSSEQVRNVVTPWTNYTAHAHPNEHVMWAVSARFDNRQHAPWGRYESRLQPQEHSSWVVAVRHDERASAPWGGPMQAAQPGRLVRFGKSARADHDQFIQWAQFSRPLAPGWGVVFPVHQSSEGLEALYAVPIQRVYMQVNTASLRRVDTDTPLPTLALSLSLDSGSWVWSFNASLPADALSLVEPVGGVPVELEAMINGTPFRLLAERIARSREFGKATIAISGRGKAALLDAPFSLTYQFSQASDRTAQQLMGEALGVSEFGATWALDWQSVDWLVPGGVWSFTGSQIGALNTIASAAGLYIQPHTSDLSLAVLPQYPFAPWDWGDVAPDYELPSAVVTRESIEWADKPAYNRVFVSGTGTGILGQVTRNATAGDLVAPMITDPLITADDAARQRGTAILSDTGRIASVSLRLPVLALTGIILPGKFVRYVDGGDTKFGIVRSTSLEVAMPGVWQTIGVETHVS